MSCHVRGSCSFWQLAAPHTIGRRPLHRQAALESVGADLREDCDHARRCGVLSGQRGIGVQPEVAPGQRDRHCAAGQQPRCFEQFSERRELVRERFGGGGVSWNFSLHYVVAESVAEEWKFANIVREHPWKGFRVVVHCAKADVRHPASAVWCCAVACRLGVPEAAAVGSQHPAQCLARFHQMVWLQQTVVRQRGRPPFRWAGDHGRLGVAQAGQGRRSCSVSDAHSRA